MAAELDRQTALIYAMVLMSAADDEVAKSELALIGEVARTLPALRGYESQKLLRSIAACRDLLGKPGGAQQIIQLVKEGLPATLQETAYVLACEVLAADGKTHPEESRLLRELRTEFAIPELTAAALHRAARTRCATV
jgi:tellurite resistance protein